MQLWDFAALTYYPVLDRFAGSLNGLVIEKLDLKPGNTVLDIGCGTGVLIPALVEAVGPQGRVVAMDSSARMVALARKRAKWPNVEVRQADACDTDHGAGQFDAAVALGAFSAMPDVPAAIANAADALKPGGRLFVFEQVEPVFQVEGETTTVVVARKLTGTATRSACTPSRPAG